ncbi:MAG: hypothetical protein P1V35_09715 [Planctomycetota bacterium]|nr:hypothetical protein [Planctomycetota bacterium]
MGRHRLGGMQTVACLALGALAIWPVKPIDRAVDWVGAPSRPMLRLGAPLWGVGHVQAASSGLQEQWALERFESETLEELVRVQAVPQSLRLESGIALHAEAVGRPKGQLDSILVRVWRIGLAQVGQPVTTGDHFVGLVTKVDERRGERGSFEDVTVQLITAGKSRIGASVYVEGSEGENSTFVVGGLLAPEDFDLGRSRQVLAVHHPSSRLINQGIVQVTEAESGGRDQAWLANGFLLGHLHGAKEPDETTRMEMLGVVPEVDFESGLYQVLIHTGLEVDPGLGQGPDDRKRGTWVPIVRSRMVDAAPWREGSKLLSGYLDGVQERAALSSGVRLVGRVTRTGPFTSDVAGPGDLGFHVPVIAVWQDVGRPERTHVLGRLVSLGRDGQGRLLMDWQANLPLDGESSERAHLYTGSGDPGVPRGLLIGETHVPTGPGPHVLVVEPPPESDVLQNLSLFQFEGPSKFVRRSR